MKKFEPGLPGSVQIEKNHRELYNATVQEDVQADFRAACVALFMFWSV